MNDNETIIDDYSHEAAHAAEDTLEGIENDEVVYVDSGERQVGSGDGELLARSAAGPLSVEVAPPLTVRDGEEAMVDTDMHQRPLGSGTPADARIEVSETAAGDHHSGAGVEVPVEEPGATDKTDFSDAVMTTAGRGYRDAYETEDDDDELSWLVPDGRPVIRVTGGNLPEVLLQAQELLRATGNFFCSGGQIVSVNKDPLTKEATVAPATRTTLTIALSRAAAWLKESGRGRDLRRIDAPDAYCAKLLQLEQFEGLLPLAGVAGQPFLRPDGSICGEPGYDAATGLYGSFERREYPLVCGPSRSDAEAALERLEALLKDFPFVGKHDRSAALAAMLTAAARPSLALAPMFLVTAPEAGTGKTFLCMLIAALATARVVAPQTFPRSEEEVDRILLAELRNAPPVVFFDNLTEDIRAFQKLCAVLTSERVSGRILRSSTIANVSTRTLLLATGNNVKPARDMQRRCITIALDPQCETPASRVFREPDLLGRVMRQRGAVVADALAIVGAWIAAGRPMSECPPLAGYNDWSSWCRQPLLWLGRSDPAQSAFAAMHDDPERQLLHTLLEEWRLAFGARTVMVRDLVEGAVARKDAEGLRGVLIDISDQGTSMNPRRIGHWLSRHAGRVAGGLRIVRAPRTRNADSWKVVSV